MKPLQSIFILLIVLCFSCKNDDDDDDLVVTEISNLENATASIASFNSIATVELENGNTITTQDENLITSLVFENSFIGLFNDRLVRSNTTDFSGEPIWEHVFETPDGEENTFDSETVKIDGSRIYLTFRQSNDFIPGHFLQAINLTDGSLAWSYNQIVGEFRRLAVVNNTIITSEGPQGNETIVSHSIEDGEVLNTWTLGERVSHIVSGDNEAIIMSWSDAIYSIQEDLSLNWSFDTLGSNVQEGVVTDGQFIFHSRDQNIYALDLESGSINWSQDFPELFIEHFFKNENSVWSISNNVDDATFNIQELAIENGSSLSSFTSPYPVADDLIDEIAVLPFDDYIFIAVGIFGEDDIGQLLNYKTQELLWQSEIALNDISLIVANVIIGTNRYTPTSF